MNNIINLILILLFLPELSFGQENLIIQRTAEVRDLREALEKQREVEFGGGDVWGTIIFYENGDGIQKRIFTKYDAGDYGNGEIEFFVVNEQLIFQKEYILDWLIKGNQEGQSFKLRETNYYFSDDSTGFKTSKHIFLEKLEVKTEDYQNLKKSTTDMQPLELKDYIKQMHALEKLMKTEVIKD